MKDFCRDIYYIRNILIVILTPLLLLPLPLVAGGQEAVCAYSIIIMAVFWITEALPIAVTALLPVFLFPITGLLSVKATSQQYINDTNMLFVGGLIVAAAIETWDIHRRIALKILLWFGSEPRWLMLGLMMPTWFLSMWISNTATTAMMIPIANAILLQLRDTDKSLNQGNVNEGLELDEKTTDFIGVEEVKVTIKIPEKCADGETPRDNVDINQQDLSAVLREEDDPGFLRMCKALSLGIAYAANVGGTASLTGTGPNLVFKGQLDQVFERYNIDSPITFASWMGFGVPTSLVLVIIVWVWLQIFFLRSLRCCHRQDEEKAQRVKTVITEEYEKLGPITFGQGAVIGHFIVLAVLWITRDMGGAAGWGQVFRKSYVKDAVPAMFIASLLFIFPSKIPEVFCYRKTKGYREPLTPLMSWKQAADKVPWGVVFLLGGGFAMANASTNSLPGIIITTAVWTYYSADSTMLRYEESGLSTWLGAKLSVFDYLDPWVLNLVLCYIVAAATEVTSNTATCTLMMPILANLAIFLKLNPMYLMYPTAIATSFAFMLPVATPPNAVAFSYGYVKVIDMVSAGFLLNVVCVLVLIGSSETIGQSLFDFHTVPAAILRNITTTPAV